MMKPWHRLLLSQLFLVGIVLNLCAAIRRDDFSARAILTIIAETVLYAGWVLPFAGSTRADKIAPWLAGCGASLMISSGLVRGFDIESLPGCMAVCLSVPVLILLMVGAGYGLARLRR